MFSVVRLCTLLVVIWVHHPMAVTRKQRHNTRAFIFCVSEKVHFRINAVELAHFVPVVFVLQNVGEGSDEGSMQFLPPGIKVAKWGKRNIEFFDKIKLVLDRLEERPTAEEGKIFDLYCDEMKAIETSNRGGEAPLATRPRRAQRRPRLGVSLRVPIEDSEVDTSWKDGRSLYPKRSSQIGEEYQVTFLPEAGTFNEPAVDNPE